MEVEAWVLGRALGRHCDGIVATQYCYFMVSLFSFNAIDIINFALIIYFDYLFIFDIPHDNAEPPLLFQAKPTQQMHSRMNIPSYSTFSDYATQKKYHKPYCTTARRYCDTAAFH